MKSTKTTILRRTRKKVDIKEKTLLDEFKEAFDDIKHGRVYDWDEIDK